MRHRVGNHTQHFCFAGERFVAIVFYQLFLSQLARRHDPFRIKRRVGKGRTELSTQDPRWETHVTHAKRDGREFLFFTEPQDSDIVDGVVGHRRYFDDIGIQSTHHFIDRIEIVRCLEKIVVADDAFCIAVAWDFARNVRF